MALLQAGALIYVCMYTLTIFQLLIIVDKHTSRDSLVSNRIKTLAGINGLERVGCIQSFQVTITH